MSHLSSRRDTRKRQKRTMRTYEAQLEAAKEANKELSEAGLFTFETKNSACEKTLSSKGVKITPQMVKVARTSRIGGWL